MPRRFFWDLIRVTVVFAGILGIILGVLNLHLWNALAVFPVLGALSQMLEIAICGLVIIGWGILGWDIWEGRSSFFTLMFAGLFLILLFGNFAGVLLLIAAIFIPLGS